MMEHLIELQIPADKEKAVSLLRSNGFFIVDNSKIGLLNEALRVLGGGDNDEGMDNIDYVICKLEQLKEML